DDRSAARRGRAASARRAAPQKLGHRPAQVSRRPARARQRPARAGTAMSTARRILGSIACLMLLSASQVCAHVKSLSYSSWQLDPTGARVEARLTATDVSMLGLPDGAPGSDALAGYLVQHLRLESDGKPCPPDGPPTSANAAEGWVVYDWRVSCPPGSER